MVNFDYLKLIFLIQTHTQLVLVHMTSNLLALSYSLAFPSLLPIDSYSYNFLYLKALDSVLNYKNLGILIHWKNHQMLLYEVLSRNHLRPMADTINSIRILISLNLMYQLLQMDLNICFFLLGYLLIFPLICYK